MKQRTKEEAVLKVQFFDILTETLREGAQQMLLDKRAMARGMAGLVETIPVG